MRRKLLLIYLSMSIILVGCSYPKKVPPEEMDTLKEYEKVVTTPNPYTVKNTYVTSANSLYNENFNLFSDIKAFQRGDILYIVVYESIDAIQQLATQTGQEHAVNNAISSFFGIHPNTLKNLDVNWNYSSSSKYKGATLQTGVVTTRLAAYIKKVYPNGNMLIEASRYLYLNDGGHRIILRGIVRPEDIGPDNSVPSSRIANLEIIYDGKGYMVDASSPGWFTRFLANIWPF